MGVRVKKIAERSARGFSAIGQKAIAGMLCVFQDHSFASSAGKDPLSVDQVFYSDGQNKTAHRRPDVRYIESSSLVAAGFGTLTFQPGCRVSSGRSLHRA